MELDSRINNPRASHLRPYQLVDLHFICSELGLRLLSGRVEKCLDSLSIDITGSMIIIAAVWAKSCWHSNTQKKHGNKANLNWNNKERGFTYPYHTIPYHTIPYLSLVSESSEFCSFLGSGCFFTDDVDDGWPVSASKHSRHTRSNSDLFSMAL